MLNFKFSTFIARVYEDQDISSANQLHFLTDFELGF
jgi:hypothetical protein